MTFDISCRRTTYTISGKKMKPTMQSATRPGDTGPSTQRDWPSTCIREGTGWIRDILVRVRDTWGQDSRYPCARGSRYRGAGFEISLTQDSRYPISSGRGLRSRNARARGPGPCSCGCFSLVVRCRSSGGGFTYSMACGWCCMNSVTARAARTTTANMHTSTAETCYTFEKHKETTKPNAILKTAAAQNPLPTRACIQM